MRPFAGSTTYYRGYQCIELVARYLAGPLRRRSRVVANGAQAVDRYAAAYPDHVRQDRQRHQEARPPSRATSSACPTKTAFSDVGHTGIVISSSVNNAGNGTIRPMEQNCGGTTGAKGYHTYTVKAWRVKFAATAATSSGSRR